MSLGALHFANRFVSELPADADHHPGTRQVYAACYSHVHPTPVPAPRLLAYSPEVAESLGLSAEDVASDDFVQIFSGNCLLSGMQPHATCYGGHQFGHWAGQLGDGRAINLGEIRTQQSEHYTLQLKGAGRTPYSRHADGRAVLRSSLREFVCSEAMHHLGIPTTRALSLIATGDGVLRDMFYDGNARIEPGAIVCRVAESFIRFGHFEIFAQRNDTHTLRLLADFTLRHHFPHLGTPGKDTYLDWFDEVMQRTLDLTVHWMRVGFVHGVMNTDNMSILGQTIDYGPYGWLEEVDPFFTPNTTDAQGRRYCFTNQPSMAGWNLARFAEALLPLIGDPKPLQERIDHYPSRFDQAYRQMMLAKLGLLSENTATDHQLITELMDALQAAKADYTLFFRMLGDIADTICLNELQAQLANICYNDTEQPTLQPLIHWLKNYLQRRRLQALDPQARRAAMHAINPKFIARNYLAQQAIDHAEQGEVTLLHTLLDLLRRPYDEQPEHEAYAAKRPEWARQRPGCAMLSCSS